MSTTRGYCRRSSTRRSDLPLERGQVLLYNHMPFLIPVLRAIVSADYLASFYRWLFLLVVLYGLGFVVMSKSLRQTGIDRDSVFDRRGLVPVPPRIRQLDDRARYGLSIPRGGLWAHGSDGGRELLSGIGLSLGAVRPHVVLVFALPMLFRHPKVFVGFTLGSGALALVSLTILGTEGSRAFIDVLRLSAGGRWYGLKEDAMYNLIGLLCRAAPQLTPELVHAIGWLVYGAAILGLCALWARASNPKTWLIGPTVALGLFVVPHLHLHDLALLLIAIYEWIRSSRIAAGLKASTAIALPMAVSLLLLVSNVAPGLRYKVPVSIVLLLAADPCYTTFKLSSRSSV